MRAGLKAVNPEDGLQPRLISAFGYNNDRTGVSQMSDIKQELVEIKMRLEKLESRMSFLFRSLGIESEEVPSCKASPAIIELMQRGDKVAAIKAFRDETGASLKDAKNFIESLII